MPKLSLREETSQFRIWAEGQKQIMEWETLYPCWSELNTAAAQTLDDDSWRDNVDDIIYVLARDNEAEVLRADLRARPEVLRELAPLILERGDRDARWQLAQTIGEIGLEWGKQLLCLLADDPDEYVRLRAHQAMDRECQLDPEPPLK